MTEEHIDIAMCGYLHVNLTKETLMVQSVFQVIDGRWDHSCTTSNRKWFLILLLQVAFAKDIFLSAGGRRVGLPVRTPTDEITVDEWQGQYEGATQRPVI